MNVYEIQELVLAFTASLAVLIPITGLTLRFALRPFMRELADLRAGRKDERLPAADQTDARLVRIEQQLEGLETSIKRLTEVAEFDRQLRSGRSEG